MDTEIIVDICQDNGFIMHVMESVWDETCEDGAVFDEYQPNPNDVWLEVRRGSERLGAYTLHAWNASTFYMHAQVLPQFRRLYTQDITDAVHRWLLDNCFANIQKFITFIPDRYKNVISYVKKAGWNEEGVIAKSYIKDGVLYDLHIMGITRDQMSRLV
jgi:hypothetical protein